MQALTRGTATFATEAAKELFALAATHELGAKMSEGGMLEERVDG